MLPPAKESSGLILDLFHPNNSLSVATFLGACEMEVLDRRMTPQIIMDSLAKHTFPSAVNYLK